MTEHRRVEIFGAACGQGSPDPRSASGPAAIRASGLLPRLRASGVDATWHTTLRPPRPGASAPLAAVADVSRELALRIGDSMARDCLPLVLGGDHSCAIGTWKGVARALGGPLGLIWLDAHMDAHTRATSESGMLHGMPLACLLGFGDPELTGIAGHARLDPGHLCLIGIRSFEAGEAALLRRLGVRICTMQDVNERGLDAVMREARAYVSAGTAGYGVSLDLDAIDPRDAPGVGSPVAGGLRAAQLIPAMAQHARDPALRALEIVEYNPYLDRNAQTVALVHSIAEAALAPQMALEFAPANRTPDRRNRGRRMRWAA